MKNNLIRLCIALCLCTMVTTTVFAQQTVTISGSNFKDAVIYKDTRPGYEYLADNITITKTTREYRQLRGPIREAKLTGGRYCTSTCWQFLPVR